MWSSSQGRCGERREEIQVEVGRRAGCMARLSTGTACPQGFLEAAFLSWPFFCRLRLFPTSAFSI
jgi:hypothetical protein